MGYAISGGHQKTIEAAEVILKQGGNAVDAAIAAYFASFISEPCMASLGAGGFALVNDTSEILAVDFFCQTPRVKRATHSLEFFPVTVDFGNTTEDFHVGLGSIAVPGAIAGIYALHDRWGSLPIKALIEPAYLWSKEGIALDRFQSYDFQLLKQIFALDSSMKDTFFRKDGTTKREGDVVKMPGYSDFLTALQSEGKDLVYKGEISKIVERDVGSSGHLTRSDFENYRAIFRKPVNFEFRGKHVHTVGFPSVGGMILTGFLNEIQDLLEGSSFHPYSESHFQNIIKASKAIKDLKNDPYQISRYLWDRFGISVQINSNAGHKWGGTSHFNVMDENGMTVSLTTSIGEGSGYFIPGTDMQLNNMLGEEALMPNGFHNWTPNVRLQSMMCPSLVTSSTGKTNLSIGSGGAGRIPYVMAQVIMNLIALNMSPEEAIRAPRVILGEEYVQLEEGFEMDFSKFENVNLWKEPSLFFGGTHLISSLKDKTKNALGDMRRHGASIVS